MGARRRPRRSGPELLLELTSSSSDSLLLLLLLLLERAALFLLARFIIGCTIQQSTSSALSEDRPPGKRYSFIGLGPHVREPRP